MENGDTANNQGETPSDPARIAPKKQTRKERSKASATSQKPEQNKKKSYRRSWRSASPLRKLEIIALGIGAMVGIGYLGVTILSTLQTRWNFIAEHRPRVIISHPPELAGILSCQVTRKEIWLHTGPMHLWVKNTAKGNAVGAFATLTQFKTVLEKKIGDPFYDDPPVIEEQSCMNNVKPEMTPFPVHGEEELRIDLAQTAGSVGLVKANKVQWGFNGPQDDSEPLPGEIPGYRAPVEKDTLFQLYVPVCVYYFDENGKRYGSCRTYRFLPSGASHHAFSCSQTPLSGTFETDMFGYCEN